MLCVLYGSPPCFWVMSLTDFEAHWLARLVGQWVQRSSRLWDYIVYHQGQLFALVLRFKLRSSCFHSKHFTNWLISPVLILYQEVHARRETLWTNEWRNETQWTDVGLVEAFSPISILKHVTLFPLQCLGFIWVIESLNFTPSFHSLSRHHMRNTVTNWVAWFATDTLTKFLLKLQSCGWPTLHDFPWLLWIHWLQDKDVWLLRK